MSDNKDAFFELTDAFIDLANQKGADIDATEMSEAMIYAAARYSAYTIASSCENPQELIDDERDATKHFVHHFKTLLIDNLNDYLDNFDTYLKDK